MFRLDLGPIFSPCNCRSPITSLYFVTKCYRDRQIASNDIHMCAPLNWTVRSRFSCHSHHQNEIGNLAVCWQCVIWENSGWLLLVVANDGRDGGGGGDSDDDQMLHHVCHSWNTLTVLYWNSCRRGIYARYRHLNQPVNHFIEILVGGCLVVAWDKLVDMTDSFDVYRHGNEFYK